MKKPELYSQTAFLRKPIEAISSNCGKYTTYFTSNQQINPLLSNVDQVAPNQEF